MAKNITHASPSVPITSSFWLSTDHVHAARYQGYDKENEISSCYMKNGSTIGSDTKIWIKSSGGGYAKSPIELQNGFNKNKVLEVNTGLNSTTICATSGGASTINDTIFSGSFESASHGDLFSLYTVGNDWDETSNLTSSRFVFVNGVLTKRKYEFDPMLTTHSCMVGHFPTLGLPDDNILFKRDNYGDVPVRGIMFISHSFFHTEGAPTLEAMVSRSINYCVNNNYGFYYTNGNSLGTVTNAHNWLTTASTNASPTDMLAKAINHYSPWYNVVFSGAGVLKFDPTPGCSEGLIDNIGKNYLINRKAIGDPTGSCFCCDGEGFEIHQTRISGSHGYQTRYYSSSVNGTTEDVAYWYDWNHYNAMWNGTYIDTAGTYDVPTADVYEYKQGLEKVDVGDCGCSKGNDYVNDGINSGHLSVHGVSGSITSSFQELSTAETMDGYLITKGHGLQTKRPGCECNTIKGWKNISLDTSGGTNGLIYELKFSDGYVFKAGSFARLITHNTTQRNGVSASAGTASVDTKWPYEIKLPTVLEIFNNKSTYTTASREIGFIKCADLYPGNSHAAGHVFLESILEYNPMISNSNNDLATKPVHFLDVLDDSEFTITSGGVAKTKATVNAYQKHSHMTTYATNFPRSKFTSSAFSGCVMVENGLYVLFEDFCYTGSGCMDATSTNYDWKAVTDDHSCTYTFTSSLMHNKIYSGSFKTLPATWSSAERGYEKIPNYDINYPVHSVGIDVWGKIGGAYSLSGTRFNTPISKSIFTTDGFDSPIYQNSFGYATRSLGPTPAFHPAHGPLSASANPRLENTSVFAVPTTASATLLFTENAANWEDNGNLKYTDAINPNTTVSISNIADKTANVAQSGVELLLAFSYNSSIIVLTSPGTIRNAGVITLAGGHTVRYSHWQGGSGTYILYVVETSMTSGFLSGGTAITHASGFYEITVGTTPNAVKKGGLVRGTVVGFKYGGIASPFITPNGSGSIFGTYSETQSQGGFISSSTYYNEILVNKFSDSSESADYEIPINLRLSSSLYSTHSYNPSYGNPGLSHTNKSNFPFSSAPTMSQYDWSYSNGSGSNVTLVTSSVVGSPSAFTYYKNALQAITYLDLTQSPVGALPNYDDLAVLGGLEFLRLELSTNAGVTQLDFKSNANLKYLEIKDAGFLEELDVSSNKMLESIEIEGTNKHFRKMHLNNNCHLKSLNLTRALSLDSATTFDIELYGGGDLEDITIVGGALDRLDLTRNKNLKNVILTELPNLNKIDVSCAGSSLQSLFIGHSAVNEVRMGQNTHVKALSLVNTKVSQAIDLTACNSTMRSLSYRNCNFSGSDSLDFGDTNGHIPDALIDLDVTNTGIHLLKTDSTNLETIIAGENETLTRVILPHNNLGKIKNFDVHGANHPLRLAGFSGSDSIEILNVQGCRITSSIYWPSNSIQIMMNDNIFTTSTQGGKNEVDFLSTPSLGHLEIENCKIDDLKLTTMGIGSPAITNRIKNILASNNRICAVPTASVAVDGTSIVGNYISSPGDPFPITNFNGHLLQMEYVQVLDLSNQQVGATSFTYLDLQENQNIRVLNVSDNAGLKAIRFVSHSVLKNGSQAPQIPGAAATLTINLTGCTAFTHFIVESAESSESLHYMDDLGLIQPGSVAGGWEIAVAVGGL